MLGVGEMETIVSEMGGLERAVKLLRPFVKIHGWDYAVVWKLNDDPSRFGFISLACVLGFVFFVF